MDAMDTPAPTDILAAAFVVGLLFLMRFALAVRRIRHESGPKWRGGIEAWRDVTRPQAFGQALEPNRRHAARQLYVGLFALALSVILAVWLAGTALFSWPVPFAPGWGA